MLDLTQPRAEVILDWTSRPIPIRHVTVEVQHGEKVREERRLEYTEIQPLDFRGGEREVLTDAERLLVHAGVLRRSEGRKAKHKLTRTPLGGDCWKRLQSRGLV